MMQLNRPGRVKFYLKKKDENSHLLMKFPICFFLLRERGRLEGVGDGKGSTEVLLVKHFMKENMDDKALRTE